MLSPAIPSSSSNATASATICSRLSADWWRPDRLGRVQTEAIAGSSAGMAPPLQASIAALWHIVRELAHRTINVVQCARRNSHTVRHEGGHGDDDEVRTALADPDGALPEHT